MDGITSSPHYFFRVTDAKQQMSDARVAESARMSATAANAQDITAQTYTHSHIHTKNTIMTGQTLSFSILFKHDFL